MTLLLTEAEVRSLLTMPVALEVVEESLREQGEGKLVLASATQAEAAGQRAAALHGGCRPGSAAISE